MAGISPYLKFALAYLTILYWDIPVIVFLEEKGKLRHSPGRPSRSDFVRQKVVKEIILSVNVAETFEWLFDKNNNLELHPKSWTRKPIKGGAVFLWEKNYLQKN